MNKDNLVVGTVYEVSFDDCCVSGNFTSALKSLNYEEDLDGTKYVYTITFENGVELGECLKVDFVEKI
jgi:hypothetical protein